jgi:O-antigen/teichoic acid export membrane protein
MARGVSGSFLLKLWYAGAVFLISVALARLLGTREFGLYSIAISWSSLLIIVAKLGQDQIIVRFLASYRETEDHERSRGLIVYSFGFVALLGVCSSAVATMVVGRFFPDLSDSLRNALVLAFWLVPLQVLVTAAGSISNGYSQVVRAQIPTFLVIPTLFLFLIGIAYVTPAIDSTAAHVVGLQMLATLIGLTLAGYFVAITLPRAVFKAAPRYETGKWLRSALPIALMGGMYVINMNADIVMLGALASADMAGVYKAATRGADLVVFSLAIILPSLGPIVARLHTAGDRDRLQRGITKVARIGLLLSLPVALVLVVFGHWFLFLFGEAYVGGRTALAILSLGQLVNVLAGPCANILIMTGNERIATAGVAVSTVVNISLNAVLIPVWGLEGAAFATAISIVIWNALLVRFTWRLLGLDPTAPALLRRWGSRGEKSVSDRD